MDLKIVKFIQSGANTFFDFFFSQVTKFGEEAFFVTLFLILYWCVSYKYAFKFSLFYLSSVLFNNVLKIIVNRPRPWHISGDVINKVSASGKSFPSGHSQGISCMTTFVVYDVCKNKGFSKFIKTTAISVGVVLSLLVGYSRIYLGQHYLTDVLAGYIFGVVIVLLLKYVFTKISPEFKQKFRLNLLLIIVSFVMIVCVCMVGISNLNLSVSVINKIFKYAAMAVSATAGYILSTTYIPEYKQSFGVKVLKTIVGFLILFGIYSLVLMVPQTRFIKAINIMLVLFVATFVYPFIFTLFYSKLKKD